MKNSLKVLLFIITFTSINLYSQPEGVKLDGVIAIIGKNIVLHSELESQYAQASMQGQTLSPQMKCELLEELMLQKLLLAQAQFDSIAVTENEVETELERRLRFFISQIGSREALEKYYNKSILEIKAEFRELIQEQMLIQKMQQQITADVKVTPSEVKNFFNKLTDEEIPLVELEFQLSHLVIFPQIAPEEKELVRDRMTEIRQRVLKGDSFGALAVMFSEDPGSSRKRGELGFFGRGEMFPEFEAAAFKLQSPNEISPIVETKAGFHILQLIERRGELVNVRHILLTIKPSEESIVNAKNKIDSVYRLIDQGTMNFEEAIAKFSMQTGKAIKSQLINPNTMDNKFLASHLDAPTLFAIEKLPEQSVSRAIPYTNEEGQNGYRLVYINKKTPPHKANLTDDYPLIHELALEGKKHDVLNEWIKDKKNYTFIKIVEPYNNCDFEYNWKN